MTEILGSGWMYRNPLATFTLGLVATASLFIVAELAWLHKLPWSFAVPIMVTVVAVGGKLLYTSVKAKNADWVCLKCGNEDSIRRSKYCSKCGARMVAVKRRVRRCPNGHEVSEHDKYCPKCGAKIEVERL